MMSNAIKCEESQARPRSGEIGAHIPEAKFVKRRRRDPSSVASDQMGKQPVQVDQTTSATTAAATTTTVKRSSRFRGVSRHRWTGRFEAHLWDKGSWNPTQRKKGKQVYLGAFDEEEAAARAYDLAAIKYWGPNTFTNFQVSDYEKEIEIMQNMSKEEYLASLRRRSSGFSRGVSKYRGVARHHHNGRWEARIGRVFGNKYLYLGTYSTQEEAAHAYDIAAIEYRGINAVTNFDLSTYIRWLRPGENSLNIQDQRGNIEYQPISTLCNPNPINDFAIAIPPNPYSAISSSGTTFQKQEIFETKMQISPSSKSSSPSALGLLLRSSMFRDLVERNSSVMEIENEKNEKKKDVFNGSNGFGRIFPNDIGSNLYASTSSSTKKFPDLELEEDIELPLFHKTGQCLWDGP